jgi:G:T-mismatch repair DNA endonuclease (very short patch repair protein)
MARRRALAVGATCVLCLRYAPAMGYEAPTPVVVSVPTYFAVDVSQSTLARVYEELERIFAPSGIRFRWVEPNTGGNDKPSIVTLVVQDRPARSVVRGCSRNLHDHRLGHTHLRARRVTLWTEQVRRAVHGDWDRDPNDVPRVDERAYARALGRVLAHELGHLFLSLNGHHDGGLMRSSFSHRSLTAHGGKAFRLSTRDLERIRAVVVRLLARTPGGEEP